MMKHNLYLLLSLYSVWVLQFNDTSTSDNDGQDSHGEGYEEEEEEPEDLQGCSMMLFISIHLKKICI